MEELQPRRFPFWDLKFNIHFPFYFVPHVHNCCQMYISGIYHFSVTAMNRDSGAVNTRLWVNNVRYVSTYSGDHSYQTTGSTIQPLQFLSASNSLYSLPKEENTLISANVDPHPPTSKYQSQRCLIRILMYAEGI